MALGRGPGAQKAHRPTSEEGGRLRKPVQLVVLLRFELVMFGILIILSSDVIEASVVFFSFFFFLPFLLTAAPSWSFVLKVFFVQRKISFYSLI